MEKIATVSLNFNVWITVPFWWPKFSDGEGYMDLWDRTFTLGRKRRE